MTSLFSASSNLDCALGLIAQRLSAASGLPVTLVDSIASTNTALLDNAVDNAVDNAADCPVHPQPPCALIARAQSKGRGRHARQWANAPLSEALANEVLTGDLLAKTPAFLGSLAVCTQLTVADIAMLPLHIGVALAQQLRAWGCPAQLKWPNDLVLATPAGSAKMGGILLETRSFHHAGAPLLAVVMGLGLNWLTAPLIEGKLVACAAPYAPLAPSSEAVFAGLLAAMHLGWQRCAAQAPCDFAPFDALLNCAVELNPPVQGVSQGIARGIDARGYLGVDTVGADTVGLDKASSRLWVHSGEVSVRVNQTGASTPAAALPV